MAFLVLFSCQNEQEVSPQDLSTNADKQLKTAFANSLSKALVAEKPVRDFIRTEALKMMDGDYDVPYSLVKHKTLANGKTFEETLAPYFKEIGLKDIEAGLPLLTIFVPTLPENSFSAELWNTETEIPFVAIVLNTINDIPVISPEGEMVTIPANLIPSFPVVVIKENERMVYSTQPGYEQSKATRTFNANGLTYKFLDDAFDQELLKKNSNKLRTATRSQIDQKLIDAYNTYNTVDGWQRDMIYYGITPTSPNGNLSYDFVEHITSFRIAGDVRNNYKHIIRSTSL